MKIFKIMLFLISLLNCVSVFAEDVCTQSPGALYCQTGSVDHIKVEGAVNLDGTKVLKGTDVEGGFNSSGAQLGSLNVDGSAILNSTVILHNLAVNGNFNAKDLEVVGSAKIDGNFVGKKLIAKDTMAVEGSVYCKDCSFNSKTSFSGNVRIIDSRFTSDLAMISNESYFTNSTLQNIVVNIKKENKPQILNLLGTTVVNNITFTNQKGTVYISKNSKILGKVTGAEVHYV